MTGDDIVKTLFGAALTILTGLVGWVLAKVFGSEKAIVELKKDTEVASVERRRLEKEIQDLEDKQLTQECVRRALDEALDRRDIQAMQRRQEWDERLSLQIQHVTGEQIERLVPRIVKEVLRGSGTYRRASSDSSGNLPRPQQPDV